MYYIFHILNTWLSDFLQNADTNLVFSLPKFYSLFDAQQLQPWCCFTKWPTIDFVLCKCFGWFYDWRCILNCGSSHLWCFSLCTLLGVRELWHGQFSSVLPTRYHSHCLWEEHVYSSRVLLLYQLHHVWPCLDCQCRMDCSITQFHCKLEFFIEATYGSMLVFLVACFLLKLDVSIRATPWAWSMGMES